MERMASKIRSGQLDAIRPGGGTQIAHDFHFRVA
jgi:hypothetical protein